MSHSPTLQVENANEYWVFTASRIPSINNHVDVFYAVDWLHIDLYVLACDMVVKTFQHRFGNSKLKP